MKNVTNDCKRGYYFDTIFNEIVFGLFDNDWITCRCVRVRWHKANKLILAMTEIKIYGDSWSILTELRNVFDALAELDNRTTPKQLCELLENHNFELDPERESQS